MAEIPESAQVIPFAYYSGCARCLVIFDARSMIMARYIKDDLVYQEPAKWPTDMKYLSQWYETLRMKSNSTVDFSINDRGACFVPIATWNGDPICAPHLYEVRNIETSRFRPMK